MAFQDTTPVSTVYSKTYFIENKRKYSFPVISIITDSLNFFQEDSGIYIIGNNTNYSKRGRSWERLAHLEYFDVDGKSQLKQNIGIRIHGNWGRAFPQRHEEALALVGKLARSIYLPPTKKKLK